MPYAKWGTKEMALQPQLKPWHEILSQGSTNCMPRSILQLGRYKKSLLEMMREIKNDVPFLVALKSLASSSHLQQLQVDWSRLVVG